MSPSLSGIHRITCEIDSSILRNCLLRFSGLSQLFLFLAHLGYCSLKLASRNGVNLDTLFKRWFITQWLS